MGYTKMTEEFNLSEKIQKPCMDAEPIIGDEPYIETKDIKEFIQRLNKRINHIDNVECGKEELQMDEVFKRIKDEIKKLAGKSLVDNHSPLSRKDTPVDTTNRNEAGTCICGHEAETHANWDGECVRCALCKKFQEGK